MTDADLIVDFVSNYHWPLTSQFKVIHVLGSMATEEAYLQAEEEAGKLLASVVARLATALPQAQLCSEVLSGDATYEVISAATNWHAAMIVMGYRVRSDIQGLLAGSVSRGVAVQAPCSVAIIRPYSETTESDPAPQSEEEFPGNSSLVRVRAPAEGTKVEA